MMVCIVLSKAYKQSSGRKAIAKAKSIVLVKKIKGGSASATDTKEFEKLLRKQER
jgi:hypothetical protein